MVLSNIKDTVNSLHSDGTQSVDHMGTLQALAACMQGENLTNMSSVTRVTGLSHSLIRKGGMLKHVNKDSKAADYAMASSRNRSDAYPLKLVYNWYHSEALCVSQNRKIQKEDLHTKII